MKFGFRLAFVSSLPAAVLISGTARAQAPATTRVSVDSAGAQSNNLSNRPSISADGRFVAFSCRASNLVAGDTNASHDVLVRDRSNGTTERVSVDSAGAEGNADSNTWPGSVSADGRFVAFESVASNLVAGDTNNVIDVFVRDRQNGTTERVSVTTLGVQGNGDSRLAAISADGRFVAFASTASNLVTGDTNAVGDIFVRDRTSATTERVSVATGGAEANADSWADSISADGRLVAFHSYATNLVAGDTNGESDVFVHDRQSGATECVSVDSAEVLSNGRSESPSISADGRFVAFASVATNLVGVGVDTNMVTDVFVRDRLSGTTERVSLNSSGVQANSTGGILGISTSADGRFVAFVCWAKNLVVGDTNGMPDIFVRDRVGGTTERVNVDSGGAQSDAVSSYPSISADGRFVAFGSEASNLVASDTNGFEDIFVRDRGGPPVSYCTAGTTSNGCNASMAASANPSVSLANACNITVTGVEGQKSGLLFYGVDNTGFAPLPWAPASTSHLCVKPPTQRTPIQSSDGTTGACDGSYALDWNAYQFANPLAFGNPWSAGAKVYAQAWFRDPPAAKSTNLSNAVEMTYVP